MSITENETLHCKVCQDLEVGLHSSLFSSALGGDVCVAAVTASGGPWGNSQQLPGGHLDAVKLDDQHVK